MAGGEVAGPEGAEGLLAADVPDAEVEVWELDLCGRVGQYWGFELFVMDVVGELCRAEVS